MITDNYFGEGLIAVVATNKKTLESLLNDGKRVFYCEENPVILPDNHLLDKCIYEKYDELHDYDVVEIYTNKDLFVCYNTCSNDNALFVTNKCNSNCVMCPCSDSERKRENKKSAKQLCELVEYMPSDAPYLTITGGEPTLLKEDMFTVMECVKNHFEPYTEIYLLTNGRAFCNQSFFDEFKKHLPTSIRFAIPIYGNTAESHDAITQAEGSFEQTSLGLKKLIAANMDIEIRIVVSKLNYMNLSATADYIIENFKGVSHIHIMATEMRGSAAKNRERVWIDYSDAFEYSKDAINKLVLNGFNVKLYNFPLCKVSKAYWPLCAKSITDHKVRFYDTCDLCSVKKICGGVFKTTLLLSKMSLNPITEV